MSSRTTLACQTPDAPSGQGVLTKPPHLFGVPVTSSMQKRHNKPPCCCGPDVTCNGLGLSPEGRSRLWTPRRDERVRLLHRRDRQLHGRVLSRAAERGVEDGVRRSEVFDRECSQGLPMVLVRCGPGLATRHVRESAGTRDESRPACTSEHGALRPVDREILCSILRAACTGNLATCSARV